MLETNDYEVTIKKGKDEQEISIEVNMEEYGESYALNEFQLSEYGKSVVNPVIEKDKMEFLEEQIKRKEGNDVHIGKRELRRLIREVDADYNSYQEEVDGYSNDGDD